MKIPLAASAVALLAIGCATSGNTNRGSEPAAVADATPPAGYAPIFVNRAMPIPTQKPATASLQATRIDTRNPNNIKVYLNIVDSTGALYYGAAAANMKNMWCRILDSANNDVSLIKKFTLREATENEVLSTAVAVVMDNSGSMGEARALAVQNAASAFAAKKQPQDAVAFIRYDNKTLVEVPLTTSITDINANLKKDGLRGFGGFTAIHSGIAEAINHLNATANNYDRKAIVVFTDGVENSSSVTKDSVVNLAIKSRIPVFSVDFGDGINKGYMENIAQLTGGSYNHIYGTNEFDPLFVDIYKRLKNFYVLEFNTDDFGQHKTNLKFCWGKDSLSTTIKYDNTPDIGSIALLNIPFDFDKAEIKTEARKSLSNVTILMRAYPNMTVELRGHTDNKNSTKDPNYNTTLSQKRADAVKAALVKTGIDATRITAKGYGDTMPVTSNDTEEGRITNRRTEFVIISK